MNTMRYLSRRLVLVLAIVALQGTILAWANEQDEAQIGATIEAIGVFVDFREFELVCRLYDDVSTSDYSSLWGNKPTSGSPSNRATGWSMFIPGFDTTRHEIIVKEISIDGSSARALANVVADHWLDGELWRISGTYEVGLIKRNRDWKISTWVFTLISESGDRELVDTAEEIAVNLIDRPIICGSQ